MQSSSPTDIITIPSLNINNSHSHDHSNPFYGLCFWPNGAGKNQPSFLFWIEVFLQLFLRSFCNHLPYLNPSPQTEFRCNSVGFWPKRNMSNWIWEPFLRVGVYMGVYHFSNFSQRCCLSLLVCWLILSVAPRGITPELPCLWIRLGQINNRSYTRSNLRLTSSPSPVWAVRLRPMWWPNWTLLKTSPQGLWLSFEDHPQ